jgi:predicted GTPase
MLSSMSEDYGASVPIFGAPGTLQRAKPVIADSVRALEPPEKEMGMSIVHEVECMKRQLLAMDQARVRVALFGQPGAGKSSLINRLIGRPMAAPGVHTDTTYPLGLLRRDALVPSG